MNPGMDLAGLVGGTAVVDFGRLTVDVPAAGWVAAATAARDAGLATFDWLSAVDELDGFAVVLSVFSVPLTGRALLRTRIGRDGSLPTLTGVWAGAGWHERETTEMFGITFEGHPDPRPLLLPAGFEGHPLRKDFRLAARLARPWPGAVEPSGRRPPKPLGAP